jgi:hypothetical protein
METSLQACAHALDGILPVALMRFSYDFQAFAVQNWGIKQAVVKAQFIQCDRQYCLNIC